MFELGIQNHHDFHLELKKKYKNKKFYRTHNTRNRNNLIKLYTKNTIYSK